MAGFHHIELWVANIIEARIQWGWLLQELGFSRVSQWREGETWLAGETYFTLKTSPHLSGGTHDRQGPGVNHLAFEAGPPSRVDAIMAEAPEYGWDPIHQDRYPHSGGPEHYSGWLENFAGFRAEIVATE